MFSKHHSSGKTGASQVRRIVTALCLTGMFTSAALSDPTTVAVSRQVGVLVPTPTLAVSRAVGVYKNPHPADWNFDGECNSQDFFDFIACFFGQCPGRQTADFNGDGFINSQDLFDYLVVFFMPC